MNSEHSLDDAVQTLLTTHAEAGIVLVVAGKLEDMIEKVLLTKGREISNKHAKRIFGGMGPLSSFSGKIEIAYFFGLIDDASFNDLHLIKDIRNRFAHTTNFVFFSTEIITSKCQLLSTWEDGADPQNCFYGRSLDLIAVLAAKMDALMYANALKEAPAVHQDDDD